MFSLFLVKKEKCHPCLMHGLYLKLKWVWCLISANNEGLQIRKIWAKWRIYFSCFHQELNFIFLFPQCFQILHTNVTERTETFPPALQRQINKQKHLFSAVWWKHVNLRNDETSRRLKLRCGVLSITSLNIVSMLTAAAVATALQSECLFRLEQRREKKTF